MLGMEFSKLQEERDKAFIWRMRLELAGPNRKKKEKIGFGMQRDG
jgi:hypothetical protein